MLSPLRFCHLRPDRTSGKQSGASHALKIKWGILKFWKFFLKLSPGVQLVLCWVLLHRSEVSDNPHKVLIKAIGYDYDNDNWKKELEMRLTPAIDNERRYLKLGLANNIRDFPPCYVELLSTVQNTEDNINFACTLFWCMHGGILEWDGNHATPRSFKEILVKKTRKQIIDVSIFNF